MSNRTELERDYIIAKLNETLPQVFSKYKEEHLHWGNIPIVKQQGYGKKRSETLSEYIKRRSEE